MTDWNEAESRHLLIIGALERMDKLLPCPFCGSDEITVEETRPPDEGYHAECDCCDARGPLEVTEAMATLTWNKRQSYSAHEPHNVTGD